MSSAVINGLRRLQTSTSQEASMHARSLALSALLGVGSVVVGCADQRSLNEPSRQAAANHDAHGGADVGFTDGWQNGKTVSFFYTKQFFCSDGPPSGAPSGCEVGEDGTADPRPGPIPVLYVMTPTGFRPPESTLQCPTIGHCIDHPSTIDLSRVFGPGFADVPLPAHSHIIDSDLDESQANGGEAGWWEINVIGVSSPAVWDQIVAGKSLATVRALQAKGVGITGDILSNAYLFFGVRPKT
jgi:hypothetical protein